MCGTKGALLYGGWTYNSTHYIGIFANYIRKQTIISSVSEIHRDIVESTLLSTGPMSLLSSDDDEKIDLELIATLFNA